MSADGHYLALSGGVGGAKLALGLSHCLPADQLTIVANTADDFQHYGLHIAPDLDTVMYTLAGVNNKELGWGLSGETWHVLEAMERLGEPAWFRLGDRDMATHLFRSSRLGAGATLSEVTAELGQRLEIGPRILPMTNDPVSTQVMTSEGLLGFQDYFVRRQCEPAVSGFEFAGIASAQPLPELMAVLADPQLRAVVICPSNPFVSIDPILGLPGVRAALTAAAAPIIAISPIVAGLAIKGPAAKMMAELGLPVTAAAVAEYYAGLIDCFVVDESDATLASMIEAEGMQVAVRPTIMKSLDDRVSLARAVLGLAEVLA